MKQRVIILAICIFFVSPLLGQDFENRDTLKVLCEGPIFTLCEVMPHLKYGVSAYEDSLKQYLKDNSQFPRPSKISLTLTILKSGEVKYVSLLEGNIQNLGMLVKAIKSLSNHWVPGLQNGHIVCCYRKIELEFLDDKLVVRMIGRS